MLQVIVPLALLIGEVDGIFAADQLRHFQKVSRAHGNGDVGYFVVNALFRSGQRLVTKDDLPVALVRLEIFETVVADEPSKPSAHVQQPELRPQVHEAVAAGCAGQPDDALDRRTHLHQCPEALCLIILEGGKFVHYNGVIVKRQLAVLNEPLNVLTVDDIDVGGLYQ